MPTGCPIESGPPQYLYFIACGEDLVKVGRAIDIARRMSTLQTGNPQKLRLLLALPGPAEEIVAAERFFHECMKIRRVRGEWFRCNIDDLFERVWTIGTKASKLDKFLRIKRYRPKPLLARPVVSEEFRAATRRAIARTLRLELAA